MGQLIVETITIDNWFKSDQSLRKQTEVLCAGRPLAIVKSVQNSTILLLTEDSVTVG